MISKITSQILGKGTSRLELRRQIFDKVKNIVKNDFSKEVSPIELDNYIEKIARYVQLNQKTGLHFDETDQFFLKQKKTFLKNGNEGLSINSPNPLFKNSWNLSFGVYLSL